MPAKSAYFLFPAGTAGPTGTVLHMSTDALPVEAIAARERLLLDDLTWEQYVTITDALPERPGLRTAFDGTRLELMTTSSRHEWYKSLLARMVEMLTFELGYPLHSGGNATFRREDLERGLEPDACFWIENATQIRNDRNWDAAIDPPPDLAVEIDVESTSVDRDAIYAKLGVPELWRFNGHRLQAYQLNSTGGYESVERSRAFPFLNVADLLPFVVSEEPDENALMRAYLEWLRSQEFPLGPG